MNNKIKIAHVITRLIVGGAQENVILTIDMLNKLDKYDITLFSGPALGLEGNLYDEIKRRKIRLVTINELRREINPVLDIISLIKLYNYLKKGRFRIVHTHSSKAGILGRLAAKLAKIDLIVHCVQGWGFHKYSNIFKNWLYIRLERIAARRTNYLLAVSEKTKNEGLQNDIGIEQQYRIILNLIDFNKYNITPSGSVRDILKKELDIPRDSPVIGSIIRFAPQKNPVDIIKIAQTVKRNYDNIIFLIAGDGPLKNAFQHEIEKKHLEKNIILTGIRRDIPDILNIMDIFILTSLWEGQPLVILQAMASEKPCIAYNTGGVSELIDSGINGYLVNRHDVEAFSGKIIHLLNNSEKAKEMGKQGKKIITEKYSPDLIIKKIDLLYSNPQI